jgi:CRISPR-associated protein Csd1
MIKELSEYGKKSRQGQAMRGTIVHDAIAEIPVGIDLLIKYDGSFDSYLVLPDDKTTRGEAITAKKGKARLLLDKAEEVLSYISNIDKVQTIQSKHQLFLEKLSEYKDIDFLKPVFLFYYDNKTNGLDAAFQAFEEQVDKKSRGKNIAFRLLGDNERLHEKEAIIDAIIDHYEKEQQSYVSNKRCSVCGGTTFPIIDKPHGMIKKVPDGQPSGTALVSYNEYAFESYGLTGNENSSICTNCARNYVDGLNVLLSVGHEKSVKDKNGKEKKVWVYKNRRNFYHAKDTAIVYWTKENSDADEIDLLEEPNEEEIGALFDSVATGNEINIDVDIFYSCTLSGAAARIAIRDWIEISVSAYRQNIAKWFKDIEISVSDFDERKEKIYHPSIRVLAETVKSEKSTSDMLKSRMISCLWSAAIKDTRLPLWILQSVLKQTHYIEYFESGGRKIPREPITKERAALIRLILNRNNQGGIFMSTRLDPHNKARAYVCGEIFSVLVDIQRAALGENLNASIRERFFSFATATPAAAFGRLMPLSQKHLSKLKNSDKSYLYRFFDKKLREVCSDLKEAFPALLTLEEQGQFALGYYHKKQETLNTAKQDKKLQKLHEVLENEEEYDDRNKE